MAQVGIGARKQSHLTAKLVWWNNEIIIANVGKHQDKLPGQRIYIYEREEKNGWKKREEIKMNELKRRVEDA